MAWPIAISNNRPLHRLSAVWAKEFQSRRLWVAKKSLGFEHYRIAADEFMNRMSGIDPWASAEVSLSAASGGSRKPFCRPCDLKVQEAAGIRT